MYGQWLATEYTIVHAHTTDQLIARFDRSVAVAVLDSSLLEPEPDLEESICGLDRPYRTVLTVRDRPDFRFLSTGCDEIHRKPIVLKTAVEAIDAQQSRLGESPVERERASLAARLYFSSRSTAQTNSRDTHRIERSRRGWRNSKAGRGWLREIALEAKAKMKTKTKLKLILKTKVLSMSNSSTAKRIPPTTLGSTSRADLRNHYTRRVIPQTTHPRGAPHQSVRSARHRTVTPRP